MADLKYSRVAGIESDSAATEAHQLIRKQEFDDELALRPTVGEMEAAIAVEGHPAVTKLDTPSITLTLSGQQLSASVNAGDGLVIGSSLGVNFGSGSTEVARGNHTHAEMHDPVTGAETNSTTIGITGQEISVNVKLDPASVLYETSEGIGIYQSYFSTQGHTHPTVTSVVPGFMSPALWAELTAATAKLVPLNFLDSDTIEWTIDTNHRANVIPWTGLKINTEGNGLEVDFDEVAHKVHEHPEYVVASATGQSYRFFAGNLYLWDEDAFQTDSTKPWRALVCNAGVLGVGPASEAGQLALLPAPVLTANYNLISSAYNTLNWTYSDSENFAAWYVQYKIGAGEWTYEIALPPSLRTIAAQQDPLLNPLYRIYAVNSDGLRVGEYSNEVLVYQ